ncbi:hypothetical protein STAPHY8AQ_90276 [Staphylococcus sp. 8AQ]|nr:hypothetical protein STAPHY8AQ_90276 [Staphylococcus sp. 8AQ]
MINKNQSINIYLFTEFNKFLSKFVSNSEYGVYTLSRQYNNYILKGVKIHVWTNRNDHRRWSYRLDCRRNSW